MTLRQAFRAIMAERRAWPHGSADREYRTRAGRQLVWMMRGIPSSEWSQ